MSRLESQLAALVTMSPAQLRARWQELYDAPAPRLTPDLLRLSLAYRLQEKKHGGLPAAVTRELVRIEAGETVPRPGAPELRPGTQLFREWQGRMITVTVEEGRYFYDGQQFRSLSSIAKLVTGAHWSGPRFFGLTRHA